MPENKKHTEDLDSLRLAISVTTSVNCLYMLRKQIHGHGPSFLQM